MENGEKEFRRSDTIFSGRRSALRFLVLFEGLSIYNHLEARGISLTMTMPHFMEGHAGVTGCSGSA